MIVEYHRPSRLDSAVELLHRKSPPTYPLGGGTWLTGKQDEDFAVVDLQDLPLNGIQVVTDGVEAGASVNLQQLADYGGLPQAIRDAAHSETSFNLRQMVTLGGLVAAGDATSILLTLLLAGDVRVYLTGSDEPTSINKLLSNRSGQLAGRIITTVSIGAGVYHFEKISRTPSARPELIIASARDSKGTIRSTVGGFGLMPVLLTGANTAKVLADSVVFESEYIRSIAGVLLERCLTAVKE
jgi:CO/xanthine dehydrogenase FAD-binding subunit